MPASWIDHELHGDGLVKLQGCARELSHLAVKTPQLAVELAVG
jgi:hypothetical protein